MELPEAVRKQGEAADAKIAEIQKAHQARSEPPPASAVTQSEPPKVDPMATPTPPAVAEPQRPDEPVKVEPSSEDVEATWQQKYRTLAGKYAAEVPRLNAEKRNLEQIINQLRTKAEQPPAAPADPGKPLYTEQEKQHFRELLDVNERAIRTATGAVAQEVRGSVDQVQRQLAALEHREFLKELTRLVPNWETVNSSPEWQIWLGEPDSLSGLIRDDLLKSAQEAHDASRAAIFFRQFAKEQVILPSGTVQQHVIAPSLQSQIVPAQSAGGSSGLAPQAPTYTEKDLQALAADISKGRYNANPEEARRKWDEMSRALSEGRLRVTGNKPAPAAAVV